MARALKLPSLPSRKKKTDPEKPYEDVFEEMTLLEHLDELRSRLVRTCLMIGGGFLIGLLFASRLLGVIKREAQIPANAGFDIINPTEPFVVFMKIALYIAIGIAMPVIVYQLVAFLAPGLTRREKRVLYTSLPFVSLLFVTGALFSFFFAAPRAFRFLSTFHHDLFEWSPQGNEIIGFYLTLMIGMGIAFELPIVMYLLAKLNIVSPRRMGKYRRYAALVILVAAAIITPTPDPFNMLFVALPMFVLYEVGIILGKVF